MLLKAESAQGMDIRLSIWSSNGIQNLKKKSLGKA
jgi:hypothetical protein